MKTQVTSISRFSYCLLFCLQQLSQGDEIAKLYNTTALNLSGAWNGGIVPDGDDVMLWNNLYAIPLADDNLGLGLLSQLGADTSVRGLKVTNVGGTRNLAQPGNIVGFRNTAPTGSAHTLTIGTLGIDTSTATQTLVIQSKVTIGDNQPWNIGNANTNANPATFGNNEDIAFHSQIAGAAFNFGNKTVTTSGVGQMTIAGGYTLSNGTLNVGNNFLTIQGGSSRVTTLTNTLNLIVSSGGTLRLQGNSGAGGVSLASAAPALVNSGGTLDIRNNTAGLSTTQSGPITLSAGSSLNYQVDSAGISTTSGDITVNGNANFRVAGGGNPTDGVGITGKIIGSGNLTYLNTATAANGFARLAGDNSGYSGTITLSGGAGNRILRLSSATAGSAAATWNVGSANILQVNGVSVQLGTLQGGGTVTNSSTTAGATLNVGAGAFAGLISNGASQTTALTKVGPGTLVLSGANTYTGTTTVSGGSLITTPDQVGDGLANGPVVISNGATFGVALDTAATSFNTSSLTLGSPTGGTLQVDFGNLVNPTSAPVFATSLAINPDAITRVIGKNLTAGTFPLVQYTTLSGAAVTDINDNLVLPTRTTGSLTDTGTGIDLTISATEQVKWNGNNGDDWDVDPDGLGVTGTPNWLTTVGNVATRYLQGSGGTDVVLFTDSAAGGGNVNLTTTLTPLALTVNNTTKDYTFTGSGKLSGLTGLEKSGTGSLTLANTTANDYSGGTVINAGILKLGDGTTAGAGAIAGSIANEGTLVLNRPDDHTFASAVSGSGTVEKAQSNVVTATATSILDGPLTLTAGKLRFSAGSTMNGIVSGSGELEAAGGNVALQGSDPNTNTGLVTVSAGALRLLKPEGVNAVGGNIDITGTGTLAILSNEQIPDTATIRALGSSVDSLIGSTGTETFANAIISGSVPETQLILRNLATVTGTVTVNQGILSIASAHTATVNAIVMTSATALARMAANTGTSTLNLGAGGLTASAGEMQVKISGNDQDAILNLAGDVTTTGNFAFTNAGYGGGNQNIINLVEAARTFNIGEATTTTVAPDIGGTGSLVKAGNGTLTLNPTCIANPAGGSVVNAGSLLVNGSLAGTVQVNANGTLGGSGTLSGSTVVDGTVAPGAAATAGTLTSGSSLTLGPDSDYVFQVGNWIGLTPGIDWDRLVVNSLALTATLSNPLVIHVTGTLVGPETSKTMVIATSTDPITGFNAAAITIDASGFSGTGTWVVQQTGNTLELVYTAGTGTPYSEWADDQLLTGDDRDEDADPDKDGDTNLSEFATDGEALSGADTGKVVGKVETLGGQKVLILTLPVRGTPLTTLFTGTTEKNAAVDGIQYRIQGGNDLDGWDLPVSEVTGAEIDAIHNAMPDLNTGWTYRTFRTPGTVNDDPKEFIRVLIAPAA